MPSRQRSKDRRAEQKLIETVLSVLDSLSLSIDLIGHAAGLAAPCGGQGTLFVTFIVFSVSPVI